MVFLRTKQWTLPLHFVHLFNCFHKKKLKQRPTNLLNIKYFCGFMLEDMGQLEWYMWVGLLHGNAAIFTWNSNKPATLRAYFWSGIEYLYLYAYVNEQIITKKVCCAELALSKLEKPLLNKNSLFALQQVIWNAYSD